MSHTYLTHNAPLDWRMRAASPDDLLNELEDLAVRNWTPITTGSSSYIRKISLNSFFFPSFIHPSINIIHFLFIFSVIAIFTTAIMLGMAIRSRVHNLASLSLVVS